MTRELSTVQAQRLQQYVFILIDGHSQAPNNLGFAIHSLSNFSVKFDEAR